MILNFSFPAPRLVNFFICSLSFFLLHTGRAAGGISDPQTPLDAGTLAENYPNRRAFAMNPSGNPSYSTQFAFKNLMRQARPWEIAPGGEREYVKKVDRFGNLTALPESGEQVYSVVTVGTWHPVGTYTLEWEGGGMLEPVGEAVSKVTQVAENRFEVEVIEGGGIFLEVRDFDLKNPFRNIRFWQPRVEQNEDFPFHPDFVAFLEPFGTLRFMDWMGTNNSLTEHWQDRPTAEHQFLYLEVSEGVPLEWLCLLSNHLQANPWFCMPHAADDTYVRKTAEMARNLLNPDLTLYLELSNEVWNWGFTQTDYFKKIGMEELDVPLEKMPHRAAYAKRAAEMFAIWEEVFGGTDRLQRVVGMQASTIETGIRTLAYGDYHKSFDLLGIAPYFSYERYGTASFHWRGDENISREEVLAGLPEIIDFKIKRRVGGHHALAEQYGLGLVAYEAGQHLLDWQKRREPEPTPLSVTYNEANRDPRMKDLYLQYFDTFFDNGGEMIGIFASIGNYSKWGSWAIKEYLDQPNAEAPKYQAVLEALQDPDLLK